MRDHYISPPIQFFPDRFKRPSSHDHRRAQCHFSKPSHILIDPIKQSTVEPQAPIAIDTRDHRQPIIERTAMRFSHSVVNDRLRAVDQIAHRDFYKVSLMHQRMRYRQARRQNFLIVDRENVEIDCPRAPMFQPHPTERRLDRLQPIQKFFRLKRRFDARDRIDIIRLIVDAPRLRLIKK